MNELILCMELIGTVAFAVSGAMTALRRQMDLLGVLILVLPSFKNWINATMGGPAVPATIISLVFGIVVSLMFPADTTPDDVRLKHVMDDRRGTVVEKVAAAEAAAEEEEDL